jgi:hypothetical protein
MALKFEKTENGYKITADIVVPQVFEQEFQTIEEAVEKFKSLESGEPVAPTQPATTTDAPVEPGV